ncbi:GDE4_7 [Mytilus edulis]|uniref:GDPD1_3 n=1 Tax=Mytilus edulis TaxID=6550 RepID=A0A8S3VM86_MYTED|nr:GDE4_7 [Mytilus edulis]
MLIEIIITMSVLAVIGGYIVTSVLLLKFPQILHRKKNIKFKPVHISHRGGAGEHIENTMTAFKHAASIGTDMLEIDCHITKDGQVVVSHDSSLKRTCETEGQVSDFKYEELPLLSQEHRLDFYQTFTLKGGEDRRIPLLREVFEEFPHMPINIDIKIDDDELIEKNPDIPLIFSMQRVIMLLVLFYTGLLPFVPIKESLLEVVMPSIVFDDRKIPVKFSRAMTCLLRTADVLLMSPVLFNHLRRRGMQTYLWVLNDEEEYTRAFRLGADGVMTDFPTKLKEYLDSHPEYKTQKSDV